MSINESIAPGVSETAAMSDSAHRTSLYALRLKRWGIDTYQGPVIYLHRDSHVCRAEGFEAQARVQLAYNGHVIIATLNVVTGEWLALGQGGSVGGGVASLGCTRRRGGYRIAFAGAESLSLVRAKVYGKQLGNVDLRGSCATSPRDAMQIFTSRPSSPPVPVIGSSLPKRSRSRAP